MNASQESHLRESIATFERELEWAERQLAEAVAARESARIAENQWRDEVVSLQKLIEVRRSRLNPNGAARPQTQHVAAADAIAMADSAAISVDVVTEVNRVDWIYDLVVASSERGVAPPEVVQAAKEAGIRMHKNYPYVALSKLVERGKVEKRDDGRYYKKGV